LYLLESEIIDFFNNQHNIDVIKCADWIIDLGPKGGEEGGNLVFEGTPENLIKNKESLTAKYLKEKLK